MKLGITEIKIGDPCSEVWDQMKQENNGKHCGKCQKVVVDFTRMSDAKMLDYLKHHPNSCGRFYNHQLDREIPVYESESLVLKFFRRVALTSVFVTQLWSRKAEAQEISKDTIMPVAELLPQAINIQNTVKRTVSGRVIQPDSSIHKAIGLRFRIDTFNISIDLNTTNTFSFQLPYGFGEDSMDVELYTADTSVCFKNIGLSGTVSLLQLQNTDDELIFQFDGSWNYYKTFNYQFPQITTMGIWVDNRVMFDTNFKNISTIGDTTFKSLIYTTLGWASPSYPKDDSIRNAATKKDKEVYLARRKEAKRSGWWWLLLPFSMIAIFFKWVSKKNDQHEGTDSVV